ncbi:beta-galactosidase [Meiothermus taiwanensis]|jgi:beta-galactosidase|uniref:Beta-galactosidase n=2 Tax=Meiothermus taiwanensis TaxID=172827 RepID=A0A399DWF0_9DEIN|nr:beta-galactosidase [Meiothermus taiwanensis]AWR85535.1 beta-galactosidase [Meiothermus taiwanensis WR-220]KIQ54461.1 beta-galactosidase [Meiothermus taiwanensis]KZK16404.1 beta-galactosidase [Meiothermus taiwanensis]RIH75723.1 Beta-galactosidase [Meiothermus taiwanensis]
MLGVCYYPEHWPRERWAEDARRMRELGLTYVRIGEFAWSAIEPDPGRFTWDWLDAAIETLGQAGLKVVLGTPTATPPKWLIDQHPDILAYDIQGRPRKFGSRRHYSFSSRVYREEARRIVTLLAQRYGPNPYVAGWQTDNEYGCHDTTRSYGPEDLRAFRLWLQARYGSIEALNQAWGNVFWSMAYRAFGEIDLPNQTVTEANPSHWLDFYRFSSDQVAAFNRMQTEILRQYAPEKFIVHNFMGYTPDFDHFKLAQDLDIAGWDSYPLGFTDMDVLPCTTEEKLRYAHSGHPDMAAFHHDLYRGVKPRWWVMEQQPGPVNWAHHNPSPAPGMVRLWTWEALAHGAEVVSYFRWRQFPQAQEQFHAGLNRPDFEPDLGFFEARQVAQELGQLPLPPSAPAPVALVFDYEADWVYRIQPQGQGFVYRDLVWNFYQALRSLGLDVDIVPPGARLSPYRLVVVPSLPILREAALQAFQEAPGAVVFGPRTGSKTEALGIPAQLPPGALQALLPIKVTRVESWRPGLSETVVWQGRPWPVGVWKEWLESSLTPVATFADGKGAIYQHHNRHYLAFWPGREFLQSYLAGVAQGLGLPIQPLPEGLRMRRRGPWAFAFNYTNQPQPAPTPPGARFILGGPTVAPYDLSIWIEE